VKTSNAASHTDEANKTLEWLNLLVLNDLAREELDLVPHFNSDCDFYIDVDEAHYDGFNRYLQDGLSVTFDGYIDCINDCEGASTTHNLFRLDADGDVWFCIENLSSPAYGDNDYNCEASWAFYKDRAGLEVELRKGLCREINNVRPILGLLELGHTKDVYIEPLAEVFQALSDVDLSTIVSCRIMGLEKHILKLASQVNWDQTQFDGFDLNSVEAFSNRAFNLYKARTLVGETDSLHKLDIAERLGSAIEQYKNETALLNAISIAA
jgi:hypothetical protein